MKNIFWQFFAKKRNQEFNIIHKDFPNMLSQLAKKNNIQKFIHLSSLGIEQAINSKYAMSKLQGEKKIKENLPHNPKSSVTYPVPDKIEITLKDEIRTLSNKLLS